MAMGHLLGGWRLWAALTVSALGLALAACGARGEESVTVDGQVITRRQFEAMMSTAERVLRYVADENWDDLYDLLDEESKKACSKKQFINNVNFAFSLVKLLLPADQWEELTSGLKALGKEIKAISWSEFKHDPGGVLARLDARSVELFGSGDVYGDISPIKFDEFIKGFTFEDGKARIHAPDACGVAPLDGE